MDRTERFYKIELLLRGRGCISFAQLQDELSVSPATLKRDLQYLRDRLSAPIVYDAFDNGYRFDTSAANPSTPKRQELPGLWFSENEIHALLTMHQLARRARRRRRARAPSAAADGEVAGHAGHRRGRGAFADAARQGHRHRAPTCAEPLFRIAGQRADAAPAPAPALLQAQRPQRERARGVAAASDQLPQHLVPRCLVPCEPGSAPFRARCGTRGFTCSMRRPSRSRCASSRPSSTRATASTAGATRRSSGRRWCSAPRPRNGSRTKSGIRSRGHAGWMTRQTRVRDATSFRCPTATRPS